MIFGFLFGSFELARGTHISADETHASVKHEDVQCFTADEKGPQQHAMPEGSQSYTTARSWAKADFLIETSATFLSDFCYIGP